MSGGRAWVEIESDGNVRSTHVHLVIEDADGKQVRLAVPNVVSVRWVHDSPQKVPSALIEIVSPHMASKVTVDTRTVNVSDFVSELAAASIAGAGEEPMKFHTPDSFSDAAAAAAYAMRGFTKAMAPQAAPPRPEGPDDHERKLRLLRHAWSGKNEP